MPIVRTSYRYKPPPRKRPVAAALAVPAIVCLRKDKASKRQRPEECQVATFVSEAAEPQKSAIVTTSPRGRASVFGAAPDLDAEGHRGRGAAADALWRELVRCVDGER